MVTVQRTVIEGSEMEVIAPTISTEIQKRVQDIRILETEIVLISEDAGIVARKEQIAAIRTELQPLAEQYREIMGSNWKDESGYCNWVPASERRNWNTNSVDEALAAFTSLHGMMSKIANDEPITFSGQQFKNLTVEQMVSPETLEGGDVLPEEIADAFLQLHKIYSSTIQEMNLQLALMSEHLGRFGSGRSITPIKEHISIK